MQSHCKGNENGAFANNRRRRAIGDLGASRRALLLSAAAGAVFFGYGRPALAQSITPVPQCVNSGTQVTCTGDLSQGVIIDGGSGTYSYLLVHGLIANIAPVAGTAGIKFTSLGDVAIESDIGDFEIRTSGFNAPGIYALSGPLNTGWGKGGIVTVTHSGNITTTGDLSDGIRALSYGYKRSAGNVTVTHSGDISTEGYLSHGIYAVSEAHSRNKKSSGAVSVSHTSGTIATSGLNAHGIMAASLSTNGRSGDVTVEHSGRITVTGEEAVGIRLSSEGKKGSGDISLSLTDSDIHSSQRNGSA
ncbi:MAG: hypothetical protein MI923_20050, partial [Phycisphaerales bacterium]|nr:hypothetical protein [Phycisphaerales bacterium]